MVEGFVYVSDVDPGPMASAAAGKRVAKATLEPPWIVVDHSLDNVIVAHWPGRLFRVAVVPPRTGEEQAVMARAAGELVAGAGYTRALAVDVLEELPPSILFGPEGGAVVEVVNLGRSLTEDVASRLASARHPDAAEAYSAAWARWMSAKQDTLCSGARDLSGTLAVHGAALPGSPVGDGFMLIDKVVWDSAELRGDADAITIDEEGELVLSEPWSTAAMALIEAAMALGAPDLVSAADAAVLTRAWRSLIGNAGLGPWPR